MKVKLYALPLDTPDMVRIKSEALCLDHVLYPISSEKTLSIADFLRLSEDEIYDCVLMYFSRETAYYVDPVTDEKVYVHGWINAEMYEFVSIV